MFCCCCKDPAPVPVVKLPEVNHAYVPDKPRCVEIEIQTEEFYNAIEEPVVQSEPEPVPVVEEEPEPPKSEPEEDSAWKVVIKELVKRQESREALYDDSLLTKLEKVGRIGPTPSVYKKIEETDAEVPEEAQIDVLSDSTISDQISTNINLKEAGSIPPPPPQPPSRSKQTKSILPEFSVEVPTTSSLGDSVETETKASAAIITSNSPTLHKRSRSNSSSINWTNSSNSIESDAALASAESLASATSISRKTAEFSSTSSLDSKVQGSKSSTSTSISEGQTAEFSSIVSLESKVQELVGSQLGSTVSLEGRVQSSIGAKVGGPIDQGTDSGRGSFDADVPPLIPKRKKKLAAPGQAIPICK